MDKTSIIINAGETAAIKATVTPDGSIVAWSSSESSIATVNDGNVTGRSEGATVILAKACSQEQRCTVIVKQPAVPFNFQPYVNYAVSYGENLGLKHDEAFVSRGNWNAWVNFYSALTEETMKQNIRSALQMLIEEDREYLFVYC